MTPLLDLFPILKPQVKRYGDCHAHGLIEWENKIDPVLYELTKRPALKKVRLFLAGIKVSFTGTDDAFYDFLKKEGKNSNFPEPQIFIHAYSGVDDLALLRRLKEFPDETPQTEIEDYWVGESEEAISLLIINPEKA